MPSVNKELDLWHFIRDRLAQKQPVMLLVVATSTGSSPGRQGYKMAVGADGGLSGSIGAYFAIRNAVRAYADCSPPFHLPFTPEKVLTNLYNHQ